MSNECKCEYAMSQEVAAMCKVAKGPDHGPAPIPEEGKWVQSKEIRDISGYTHGIGWCAPQQGACKLSLNVKNGIIEEALVETIGCSGMTHSAAMAAEILPGKTVLEALNNKADVDLANLSKTGRSTLLSGVAPSNRTISVSLAPQANFQAPANGYIQIGQNGSNVYGQVLMYDDTARTNTIFNSGIPKTSAGTGRGMFYIGKGQVFVYNGVQADSVTFRYALGEKE